jgi:hypothetical protein
MGTRGIATSDFGLYHLAHRAPDSTYLLTGSGDAELGGFAFRESGDGKGGGLVGSVFLAKQFAPFRAHRGTWGLRLGGTKE